jgi:hypothetical protein
MQTEGRYPWKTLAFWCRGYQVLERNLITLAIRNNIVGNIFDQAVCHPHGLLRLRLLQVLSILRP